MLPEELNQSENTEKNPRVILKILWELTGESVEEQDLVRLVFCETCPVNFVETTMVILNNVSNH